MLRRKKIVTERLSYKRYQKMSSHISELEAFFHENIGALKNMIEAGKEEEHERRRKDDCPS